MQNHLSEIIAHAEEKSQKSLAEHKAKKHLRKLPWISTELALPQNDHYLPLTARGLYLVKMLPNRRLTVANFGYDGHDWWVDTNGKLLTSYYGVNVVGWCPLPTSLGDDTCDSETIPTKER